MDRKMIIIIVVAVLIALIIVYGISVISGGQITGQAVSSATSHNLPGMVGGCG